MVRVTNYFDTQIRIPLASNEKAQQMLHNMEPKAPSTPNGNGSTYHHLREAASGQPMTGEQLVSWYAKILDSLKQRYRKLQRLAR